MNILTACATYTGDSSTESGLRTMRFEIPGTGNRPMIVPLFILPSYAAGDSCAPGAFEEGASILISGRLYPHEDRKMYVVPTQPLQVVTKGIALNHVALAGGVGFIGEQHREDAFNFGLMCQAPKQKTLGHDWQDSLPFRIESWGDDAARMKRFLFVGRQISLGGTLKFECWTGKDGTKRTNYKIRIKSAQYAFFGKNQKKKESEPPIAPSDDKEVAESPPKAKKRDDGIPF